MEELKEIRQDIKTLLVASGKHQQKLENVDNRLVQLNGSVAKNSKRIGVVETCLKYNKGIVFGVVGVISAFWTIITVLQ